MVLFPGIEIVERRQPWESASIERIVFYRPPDRPVNKAFLRPAPQKIMTTWSFDLDI